MVKFTLKGISNLTESPAYFQQVNGIYRKDGALAYREDRASRYYDSIIAVANGNNGMISHDQLRWLSNQSQSFQSMMNSIAGAQSNSINQEGLKKLHDDPSKDSFYNDVDVLSIFNKRGVVGLSHANSLYDTAIALYEKEIKLGNATAMCNRAYMHQHGLGGSKDYAAAIVLYEQAIKLGNASAMRNRAYMHEHGLGGSKDYAAAIALYEQAIELGDACAMCNRAYMHQHGLGGSKDYAAAIVLYEQAIKLGNASAMRNRAYMHGHGLGGSKDYAAAIALYEKAIKLGNATAMCNRAYMHEHGLGGSKDYATAIALYEKAIKLGNATAMNNRAYMHQLGLGGSKDYAAAIVLYELAIKLGNAYAMSDRAYMHQHGLGGSKDYVAAIVLYDRAAVSFSNFLDREISDLLSTGSQFFTPNNLINALLPRLKTGETVSTSIYQWLIRHKKELLKQILVGEDDDTAKYKVIHSALTDQDHVLYKIFYKTTGFTPVSVDKPKSNLGQLRIKHDELATNLNLPVYDAGKFMSNSSASFFTNASTAKVDTCCEPRDAVDDCEGYGSVFNSITDAGL